MFSLWTMHLETSIGELGLGRFPAWPSHDPPSPAAYPRYQYLHKYTGVILQILW